MDEDVCAAERIQAVVRAYAINATSRTQQNLEIKMQLNVLQEAVESRRIGLKSSAASHVCCCDFSSLTTRSWRRLPLPFPPRDLGLVRSKLHNIDA